MFKKLATFKGGVHPKDAKDLNRFEKLERLPYPEQIVLPLSQGFGAPSVLVKEVGESVKRGELIASSSSALGNSIYSPVSGEITQNVSVVLPSSITSPAVVIKCSSPSAIPEDDDYVRLEKKQDALEMIKDAGIVGLGGAGFPTHIKYSVPEGKTVDYFIVNAAECEPYLCADYRLLVEKPKESLLGALESARILKAKTVYIATEDNKKDTLDQLSSVIDSINGNGDIHFEIRLMKTKYPQGDEKNLVKALTGREVPSGKFPLDAGCVVSNLGTCYAIYEAVYKQKPLIERVVSVTGEGVNKPKNVIAPLGASVQNLVDFCSGLKDNVQKMISGGPMMGFAFYDKSTPITKTTSALTFLTSVCDKESTNCISCARCVNACPMNLIPTRLFKLISHGKYKEAMDENLMDCRECGCCEFICPSNIKLVQGFKFGKKMGRSTK